MANTANLSSLSVAEINALIPAANSSLTTDFSVAPYHDDYEKTKQFYKMLWKPGFAVQGRELNQLGTMLQKQINRFGQHVFREGSIVLPGEFSVENDVDYVKIKDNDNSNNALTVASLLNETVTGSINGIRAYVIEAEDGSESSSNTKTLMVRYMSSAAANSSIKTFQANEVLTSNNGTAVCLASAPTGKGSRFVIREGVFFGKEHFIWFPTQSIVLNRYSTTPSCRVGFHIQEDIVDYTQDTSLLDPALESSNYAAPGADRLRLTPTLQLLDIDDTTGAPDFVELFTIDGGIITEIYNRSQYNILLDELAKRTVDESGDYYVRGLGVRVRENLDVNNNGGYDANGNSRYLSVGVEPGLGYVKGYPIELFVTNYQTVEKATTYDNVASQIASATAGSYLKVNEFTGSVAHDQGTTIFLKDNVDRRISQSKWASTAASGNTIGTAKVRTIEYDAGVLGTANGTVLVYLTDIKMNGTNSFSNTRAISASNFGGDVVLSAGNTAAILRETAADVLIYNTGDTGIRTLRDSSGNPQMNFNFKRTTTGLSITAGVVTIPISIPSESFPYGTGSLANADKREFLLSTDSDITMNTVSITVTKSGTTNLTSNATVFGRFNVGDKILLSANSKVYTLASIADGSNATVSEVLPTTVSGNTISKVYRNGDIIDLTTVGFAAGAARTVTTTPTQITIDLKENFNDTCKVSYQVNRTGAQEAQKLLRANCFVQINVANASAGVLGPYGLGVADVYNLRKIIKKTSSFPAGTADGTDVTSQFTFDNGQRDNLYDHATITPKSALANTDRLLVQFDFFEPSFSSGKGYFSIDSYPIDDTSGYDANTEIKTETVPIYTSPSSGKTYNLRDCVDFRPVKANTAAYSTSPSGASANPTSLAALKLEANGLRLPVPSTQFTYDYSYYLPRRDLVSIDKDKNITVIKGVPSAFPITPPAPENGMALASIFVPAYPSLAPNYAQIVGRIDLACQVTKLSNIRHTMKDIGVIKTRVANLEYYNSLNLLQKDAVDLTILDANGLNRFKNGIFVDTFADHTFGDTSHPDYRIVVDKREKCIRPIYTAYSFDYDYLAGESSGVQVTGSLVTLPYTEAVLIDQPRVTSFRNIELSSYRFVGTVELQPAIDTWVDTQTIPDTQIRIGPSANNLPQNSITYDIEMDVNGYTVGRTRGNGKGSKNYGSAGGSGTAVPLSYFGKSDLISQPDSANDQQVTRTSTETTTKTVTTYTLDEESISLGNRVVDVSLARYIRPQTIDVWGRGLKANTRVYIFFDGEAMANYAAPMTEAQYLKTPEQRRLAGFVPQEGTALTTDANGDVFVALRLPTSGKQFVIGQKEVILTDSPSNSALDASTSAKSYFTAQGLIQQKSDTVYTTAKIVTDVDVSTTNKTKTEVIGYLQNPSCSAYSFYVKAPADEEGLFLSSVDVYFARKHPTLGVWVEIRAMNNASGITRTQVPYSEVWIPASEMIISPDGYTLPHKITFPSPVFLYNDTQYAFVIHTVGLNPDTYLWISRLGETDVRTGLKVNARPLTGTFYTTNNNLNWNMVDDIDMRITFYRCDFTTNATGTAVLGNEPVETLLVTDASAPFTQYGEPATGRYKLTLSGNTSIITVGDFLVGANSGANSAVLSINGSVFTVANTKYIDEERVTIRYAANGASSGLTSRVSDINFGSGVVSEYGTYRGNTTIHLRDADGSFVVGERITGAYSNVYATISELKNYRYSKVTFEPTYLSFAKTDILFEMKPTSNAGVAGSYRSIVENDGYFFNTEQALLSRTNEIALLGGDRSNKARISMSTQTGYLSPVLDLNRTRSVYVDNIINANTTYPGELAAVGGEITNKYISKVVTLDNGQDAEDMLVYLSAYRPPTTDVLVWGKFLHNEDSDIFANRGWIPLEKTADVYSSLSDRLNYKEYLYKIPAAYMTGPATASSAGGEVQYTNSQNIKFTGYKYFAVKVALVGENSAVVPTVADLRVLAMQL